MCVCALKLNMIKIYSSKSFNGCGYLKHDITIPFEYVTWNNLLLKKSNFGKRVMIWLVHMYEDNIPTDNASIYL